MPIPGERIVQKGAPPDEKIVRDWLGILAWRNWQAIVAAIEAAHPGVFQPDWIYGGERHGWSLRFKKSKSLCTLVPEYRRVVAVIVLGKAEQIKVETLLPRLSGSTQALYAAARTYPDGKWLAVPVRSRADVADVATLLTVKRRPGVAKAAE